MFPAKNCGTELIVSDRNLQRQCAGATVYNGDDCVTACNPGYDLYVADTSELSGSGSGDGSDSGFRYQPNVTFTCGSSGLWLGPEVQCVAKDCGPVVPELDENAASQCTNVDTRFGGDNCLATCDPTYEPVQGDGIFTCAANGRWTGSLECDFVNCGTTIQGLDASASATCMGNTKFGGDHCTATCLPGFDGSSSNFSCSDTGDWVGSVQCTPKDCGDTVLKVSNTFSDCSASSFYGGTPCQVRCLAGHDQVAGTNSFICNEEGVWQGELACIIKDCGSFADVIDPNAQASACTDTTFGQICTAQCPFGYDTVAGNGQYICGLSGEWQGSLTCKRVTCGPLLLPEEQELVSNATSCQEAGNECLQATVTCAVGYDLVSSSAEYTCGLDGNWAGDVTCQIKDCGSDIPDLDENAAHQVCLDSTFGGTCYATCNPGFEAAAGTTSTYMCGATGKWEGTLQCAPVSCGSLVALPANATASCGSTKFDDECTATCEAGTIQSGSGAFVCSASGQWVGGCNFDCIGKPF
jgi:hypothetical protein